MKTQGITEAVMPLTQPTIPTNINNFQLNNNNLPMINNTNNNNNISSNNTNNNLNLNVRLILLSFF